MRKVNQDAYYYTKDFAGIKNLWCLGVMDGLGNFLSVCAWVVFSGCAACGRCVCVSNVLQLFSIVAIVLVEVKSEVNLF